MPENARFYAIRNRPNRGLRASNQAEKERDRRPAGPSRRALSGAGARSAAAAIPESGSTRAARAGPPVRRSDSRTPSHQGYRPDSRGKYTVTPRGPEPSGRSAARAASSAWCTSPAPRRATSRAIRAPGRAASDTPRTPGPADRRPQRYVTDGDGRFGFGRFLRRRRAGWTDDPRACGERRRGHC